MDKGILTVVKTLEAVVQERQGISGMGFGQLVTAKDAICEKMRASIDCSISFKNELN